MRIMKRQFYKDVKTYMKLVIETQRAGKFSRSYVQVAT